MNKQKNTLLKGTAIIAMAGFISKFLGLIYRAFLGRVIGDQGFGLYEKAYPVYTIILTVSTVAIPVAISKLISEKRAQGRKDIADYIFKVALSFSFVFGLIASISIALLAKPISRYLLDDIRVFYSVLSIAPAIFIVSIMATYRGYFQGYQEMRPTAISQVVEQIIRMISMILLAYLLLPYGIELGAAGAASGAFFGSVAGLTVVLIIYYRFQSNREELNGAELDKPPVKEILHKIISLAVPITIGALILPLMRMIDATMITPRLKVAGFSLEEATSLYGQFNGMAMTLVRFPTVIAASLAVNLVPAISESYALGSDKLTKSRISKAFKLALYVSIPSSIGLFILARPLCKMIFANEQAAVSLRYVSFGVIAVSLQQVTSSILQGVGKTKLPARNLFFGASLNIILNYTLTAIPTLGIRGAALGTVAGFTLAALLNMIGVFNIVKPDFNYNNLIIKPLFSGIIMLIAIFSSYKLLSTYLGDDSFIILSFNTLSTVFIGMTIYGGILLLTKGITKDDLKLIPKVGIKLANLLDKLGLVRG
ncbi:putative polysaccharide biosynthesis protein [Orenia marismortui]|uniref:putative polysaccharide biosynthesis protein n=1 Tax=Orenia marismortui TaxID=46469 RepID=UPI0003735B08|nr:polysaccharide biosynthesis protein [Orenia marismortui]